MRRLLEDVAHRATEYRARSPDRRVAPEPAAVQADGTCWVGGTVWQGRTAMRISVSSWATTEADVDGSVAALLRAKEAVSGSG